MAPRIVQLMRALFCCSTTMQLILAASHSSLAAGDDLAATTTVARTKVLEFNDTDNNQERRLALQVIITEPAASKSKSKRPPVSILLARKRPYDLQETLSNNMIEKYSPLAKHFYVVELQDTTTTTTTTTTTARPRVDQQLPTSTNNHDTSRGKHWTIHLDPRNSIKQDAQAPAKKQAMNQRNELVRTQHRPPWMQRLPQLAGGSILEQTSEMEVKKYLRKFRTTLAPMMPTTEFFKLISSAHSPLKFRRKYAPLASTSSAEMAPRANNSADRLADLSESSQLLHQRRPTTIGGSILQAKNFHRQQQLASAVQDELADRHSVTVSRFSQSSSAAPTTQSSALEPTTTPASEPHPTAGSVLSPTIMFKSDAVESHSSSEPSHQVQSDYPSTSAAGGTIAVTTIPPSDRVNETTEQSALDDRREPTVVFSTTLGPNETPLSYSDGKKIITLVRHKPRTTPASMATSAPFVTVPSRIMIQDQEAADLGANKLDQVSSLSSASSSQQQTIRLISKQRHKYDDRVLSPTLTVVDNDAIRLPSNATTVHNNRLLVVNKPGRPLPRHQSTTQFPVYPMVAGMPYTYDRTAMQYTRPPQVDSSRHGIIKPTGAEASATTPSPSMFGAPKIKFPAPPPPSDLLQPPANENHHHLVESIDKLNITVPASSSGSLVPEKILLQTEEQHSRPLPSDAIVMSNSTVVSRPHGTSVVNQDGIIRVSTTRRPQRLTTTKKINIVSANTTIVATTADQLHDVLSNFITGSHQQTHHTSQRPPDKPGFFASLGNLLNASVTTSAVAILTLIKTIFVAVLVMFLPPIALTAAIMQAINIG